MDDTILDIPERKEEPGLVFYNKIGGVFTTPAIYFAPLMFVVGFLLAFTSLLGWLIFFAAIPFMFSSSWLVLDMNKRQMHSFWTMYGYRIGSWKPIPPLKGVSVVRIKWSQTLRLRAASTSFEGYIYRIKLLGQGPREAWDVLDVETRERALEVGNRIAGILDVPLSDYSVPVARTGERRR